MPQLYKLEMEIVFRALESYIKDTKTTKCKTSKFFSFTPFSIILIKTSGISSIFPGEWEQFFQNKIVTKILNLMMFHSDELTEKYITVFSQYKEIEQQLQERDRKYITNGNFLSNYLIILISVGNIKTVDIADDIVPIPSNKFDTVDF